MANLLDSAFSRSSLSFAICFSFFVGILPIKDQTAFKKPTEQALTDMKGLRQDPAKMLTAKTAIAQKGAERLQMLKNKEDLAKAVEEATKVAEASIALAKAEKGDFSETQKLIEKIKAKM